MRPHPIPPRALGKNKRYRPFVNGWLIIKRASNTVVVRSTPKKKRGQRGAHYFVAARLMCSALLACLRHRHRRRRRRLWWNRLRATTHAQRRKARVYSPPRLLLHCQLSNIMPFVRGRGRSPACRVPILGHPIYQNQICWRLDLCLGPRIFGSIESGFYACSPWAGQARLRSCTSGAQPSHDAPPSPGTKNKTKKVGKWGGGAHYFVAARLRCST
jgi:hypothetical protein